jgi:redox-sensitive bicupin YhaK (pirin superfamily)
LYQILSPTADEQGVWIHQQAWFMLGNFTAEWEGSYQLHRPESGVYVFVIEGEATVSGNPLSRRDGIGISEVAEIEINATANTRILIMEIPV